MELAGGRTEAGFVARPDFPVAGNLSRGMNKPVDGEPRLVKMALTTIYLTRHGVSTSALLFTGVSYKIV